MNDTTARNFTLDDAVNDVEKRYVRANPKSEAHYQAATRTMPGANTRSTLHHDPFPVVLVKGEDARISDLDDNSYLDFLGEYTAGLYGHSEPTIKQAIIDALSGGFVLGGPNPYEARLAELMVERFPAVELIRFCNSGTEANMMNISLARAVTGRPAVMALNGSYHGGLFSFAGGSPSPMNAPIEAVIGEFNELDRCRDLIRRHADRLAALIVEPVMGGAGCIPADDDFLHMLRHETEQHGIVLIFDEVMTSRLSPGGLHQLVGITPDLISFGKYLGGGVTFGAFGGRTDLMSRLDPRQPDALVHSGTYNNNVLTMAAGIAGLSKVFTPDTTERLNRTGDDFRQHLQSVADQHDAPFQIMGRGSMICIHPQREPIRNPADTAASSPAARKLIHLEMHLRGFYLARRGFMSLSLPLTASDLNSFAEAFEAVVTEHGQVLAAH